MKLNLEQKKSTKNTLLLKEHSIYKGMYYYKSKGRWSKDFYNKTRAVYYSLEAIEKPKKVGQLPHGTY
jgi:hypothetical protein